MAKTFKDFMVECEMFPHSAEHFDLVKECSELALMEKYLEDQQFMAENASIINGNEVSFTEGYFRESDDSSTIEAITEKYNDKKKGIGSKIMAGFKKILTAFANFFRKIANHFDDTTSRGQAVLKKLNSITLDDGQVKDLQKIVRGVKSKSNSAFPVNKDQPYLSKIKLKYNSADPSFGELKNDLAAALSDQTVVANVATTESGHTNPDTVGALPVDTIKEACYAVMKGDAHQIHGAVTALAATWGTVQKNGLKIKVNTKEIDKNAQDLQQIIDKISQMGADAANKAKMAGNAVADVVNAAAGQDVADGSAGANKITEAYTMVNTCIAQSMKIYTSLNAYRIGVITGLEAFVKSVKDSSKS